MTDKIEIVQHSLKGSLINALDCTRYKNDTERYSIGKIINMDFKWAYERRNRIKHKDANADYLVIRIPTNKSLNIFGKNKQVIKPGEYQIGNINELYQLVFDKSHKTYDYMGFQFTVEFLNELLENLDIRKTINSFEFDNRVVKTSRVMKNIVSMTSEIMSMLSSDSNETSKISLLLVDTLALQLGIYLLKKHPNNIQSLLRINENIIHKDNRVQKAMDFLRDNYNKNISLDELAGVCGLSKRRVLQLFRLQVGESPTTYLNKYKVKKVIELLKNSDKTIKEIAELTGFVDTSHLTKVFVKYIGIPPSSLRR